MRVQSKQIRHGFDDMAAVNPTFTYLARRPFDPLRFYCLLHSPWPKEVDASGCFWIATRPNWMAEISCVGGNIRYRAGCLWWASVPQPDRFLPAMSSTTVMRDWHPTFGDRCQRISFTGSGVSPNDIQRIFAGCLVEGADDTLGWDPQWSSLPDPFPQWEQSHPGWERHDRSPQKPS